MRGGKKEKKKKKGKKRGKEKMIPSGPSVQALTSPGEPPFPPCSIADAGKEITEKKKGKGKRRRRNLLSRLFISGAYPPCLFFFVPLPPS